MSKRRTPPPDLEPPSLDEMPRTAPPASIAVQDDDSLPKIARTQRSRKRPSQSAGEPDASTPRSSPRKRRPPPPVAAPQPDGRFWGLARAGLVVFGGVVVAGAIAAGSIYAFMPTDMIRDRLVAEVKARTGRDLVISGTTSLSLWPRIAVSVGGVKLSNAVSFGGGDLLSADSVEAAVQIRPLLSGDVMVEQLTLRRPVIDLVVDKGGRPNWDFAAVQIQEWPARRYVQAGGGAPTPALPREVEDFVKADPAQKSQPGTAIVLEKLAVIDGTIRYRDLMRGTAEDFRSVNLSAHTTGLNDPLDHSGAFVWRGEPVTFSGRAEPFQALVQQQPVKMQINLSAAPMTLAVDGVTGQGGAGNFEGRVRVQAGSIERIASWSGRPLPFPVPGALDLATRVKLAGPVLALADAAIKVDQIAANGALTIDTRGARPFVKGTIRMADLDLNAIQALAGSGTPTSASRTPAATPVAVPAARGAGGPQSIEDLLKSNQPQVAPVPARAPQVRGYTRRKGWSDDPIRIDGLKAADAEIQLVFQRLLWKDMTTGAGQFSVGLREGNGRFTLDDLALYDGRARGVVTLSGGGEGGNVVFGTNMVAEGVSLLPLLKSLTGFDWLAGRARVAVAAAGQGLTERQIVASLNGKTELTMGDGAIQGINVSQVIRGVMQGKLGNFDRVPTEKTEFSELAGTTQIVNGVARNTDFRLKSPIIAATGAGTINLPGESIDYLMKAKIVGAIPGQDMAINLTGLEVPLKIAGPLEKPTVTPELSGLLRDPNQASRVVQEALKTPKGRELEETVRGALSGDPTAKAKAKTLLNQFLGKQTPQ